CHGGERLEQAGVDGVPGCGDRLVEVDRVQGDRAGASVDHGLDRVAHVRRAVLHGRLGEAVGLDVGVRDVVQVTGAGVDDHVGVTVDGEERGDAGDAVLDLAVYQDAAVGGEGVVQEEVEGAERIHRHGQLVEDVGDRDALHLRARVEGGVTAAARVVELVLERSRHHRLGGGEAAVDARVASGAVE